ncbi:MAG: hypothetical protein PHW64_08675 [Sulfuricurvum sp.]|nr:hypothetical protein [Sulfuricurvum sp.]
MSTIKTVSILFYKGEGTLAERLVRLWTSSPYSHCEFRRSDGLYHSNDRFNLISRTASLEIDANDWEMCQIALPGEIVERIERRQLQKNGTLYDWKGIFFSQVLRWGWHDKKRWFCSKSNADDLIYGYRLMLRCRDGRYSPYLEVMEPIGRHPPHRLAPRDLFTLLREMERIQGQLPLTRH